LKLIAVHIFSKTIRIKNLITQGIFLSAIQFTQSFGTVCAQGCLPGPPLRCVTYFKHNFTGTNQCFSISTEEATGYFMASLRVTTCTHTVARILPGSTARFRCLDVTSTHALSTGDYDPNGTTSECNDPKTFRPHDITSDVQYGPRFHVRPCFDLDVLSHVTRRPTSFTWIVKLHPSSY
jgi:hypothetical protein